METKYDSTADTMQHKNRVAELMNDMSDRIIKRGKDHDNSKLEPAEKTAFDEYTPKLKGCTYGSDEYKGYLKGLGVALDHHYKNNSHHPEHFENGIDGMNLLDLIEMIMDWKAATERHDDGDIRRSIQLNKKRFNISDQLESILSNTVDLFESKPTENDEEFIDETDPYL